MFPWSSDLRKLYVRKVFPVATGGKLYILDDRGEEVKDDAQHASWQTVTKRISFIFRCGVTDRWSIRRGDRTIYAWHDTTHFCWGRTPLLQ